MDGGDPRGEPAVFKLREPFHWRQLSTPAWTALLLGGLFFAAFYPSFAHNADSRSWRQLFAIKPKQMLAGLTMHSWYDPDVYTYPPGCAVVLMPVAILPDSISLQAWYLVNVGCVALQIGCALVLAGSFSLRGLSKTWFWTLALTLVFCGRYILAPIENQQVDALIAALLLVGGVFLLRGRANLGAVFMAIGASLKATPVLFIPWLIWRRQFRAAGMMTAVVFALNVGPEFVFPQADGGWYLTDWYHHTLAPARDLGPGKWVSGGASQSLNQSLGGMVHRYATFGITTNPQDAKNWLTDPNVAPPTEASQRARKIALAGAVAFLLGMTLWAFGRPFQSYDTSAPGRPMEPRHLRLGYEISAVFCLMLLLSPQSSKAHYATMILPTLMLVRYALTQKSIVGWASLGLLAVLGPLSSKGIIGTAGGDLTLMWGFPTWFVLVTLASLWHAARTTRDECVAAGGRAVEIPWRAAAA